MNPSESPSTERRAAATGYLSEIFCSVQGEGLYLGRRQLFVRTAGCSVSCYWCDTPASKTETKSCTVHGAEKRSLPAVEEVFRRIRPGDGPAGVFAVLKPPPKNDGGRAYPQSDDGNDS